MFQTAKLNDTVVLTLHSIVNDYVTMYNVFDKTNRQNIYVIFLIIIVIICVPPTVKYLQYLIATGSTLTAVGPVQLPAPQSGTLSRISSVSSVSDVFVRSILVHSARFQRFLTITALYKFTYLLTVKLKYSTSSFSKSKSLLVPTDAMFLSGVIFTR